MLPNQTSKHEQSTDIKSWGAVVAMSLAAFALVASEFMPVSLLTPLADDLHISEGKAGTGISVSGLCALVMALVIAPIAAKTERKRLLMSMVIVMIISGTVVAFAPNYEIFMLGRALIGIAIGGFWSLCAATVIRLVPEDGVPRALAIVNGGNALATVVAAPLGSYLGAFTGWRWAFFSVVPVAMVALVWMMMSMPVLARVANASRQSNALKLLKKPPVAIGMLAVAGFFMGQFMLFTYLRPFLESVTHLNVSMVSFVLLLTGLGGLAGTFVIGTVLEHGGLYKTLIGVPVLMSIIAILLTGYGEFFTFTAFLLGLWGFIATATPVAWFTWIARTVPEDVEAGGGLFVAICQLAIASGGIAGGMLFDNFGYRATFEMSAVLLFVTAGLACAAGLAAKNYAALQHNQSGEESLCEEA